MVSRVCAGSTTLSKDVCPELILCAKSEFNGRGKLPPPVRQKTELFQRVGECRPLQTGQLVLRQSFEGALAGPGGGG